MSNGLLRGIGTRGGRAAWWAGAGVFAWAGQFTAAQVHVGQITLAAADTRVSLREGLAISNVSSWGRRAINTDALVQAMVGDATRGRFVPSHPGFQAPIEGDLLPGTQQAWTRVQANDEGVFAGLARGSYVLVRVNSDTQRAMLLEASGNTVVYVNGEPRIGDMYGHGIVRVPVHIRAGENILVFASAGRGAMAASLLAPTQPVEALAADLTLPDVIVNDDPADDTLLVALPLANASDQTLRLASPADATSGASAETQALTDIVLAPWSVVKVPLRVHPRAAAATDGQVAASWKLTFDAPGADQPVNTEGTITLDTRQPGQTHTRTFLSDIDGSVQYVSIVPHAPSTLLQSIDTPMLALSLHGASVEARSQAASYSQRYFITIACPTNRRPFGFDWEDWGRIDALEALRFVQREFVTDPDRVFLTGHSMGGHGTWQLGVLYPDLFAAIAPSAGWLSFDTYPTQSAAAPQTPHEVTMHQARASSDTQAYFETLRGRGIYILHGDADDNVPVAQARQARDHLLAMGLTQGQLDVGGFGYHEQPGAGHWWDDANPGAACLDWEPIFKTFRKHSLANQRHERAKEGVDAWRGLTSPLDDRGFSRGSFKRAFDRRFVLIYGSAGTPEENAWALAKARFDADQWWYRGNGFAMLLRDDDPLVPQIAQDNSRNVILYGNALTNRAWDVCMPAHLRVTRDTVHIHDQTWTGSNLGALLAATRNGRTVAAIAGTGLEGSRTLDRLPVFLSGTGFPSHLVLRSTVWTQGVDAIEHTQLHDGSAPGQPAPPASPSAGPASDAPARQTPPPR